MTSCLFNKPDPSRLGVYCLPQAGADAASFKQWESALPDFVQILPVTLPGRGLRLNEPPQNDFHTLCDSLFEEMRQVVFRPFVLLGSSMGGWIAFELARRFERAEMSPELIVALASPVPDLENMLPELRDPQTAVRDVVAFNAEFADAAEYPELMELILPTIAADFRMCNRYRPDRLSAINTPVLGITGRNDPLAPIDAMQAWSEFTRAAFKLDSVDGGHSLHETPGADFFDVLRPELERIFADHQSVV
ncbi:MAG: thioesterase II family protein [Sulfitobacter sp.]